jgi:hypothetical protein
MLGIHIRITELVKRDNIIIEVEIGKNREIKSWTWTSELQTRWQECCSIVDGWLMLRDEWPKLLHEWNIKWGIHKDGWIIRDIWHWWRVGEGFMKSWWRSGQWNHVHEDVMNLLWMLDNVCNKVHCSLRVFEMQIQSFHCQARQCQKAQQCTFCFSWWGTHKRSLPLTKEGYRMQEWAPKWKLKGEQTTKACSSEFNKCSGNLLHINFSIVSPSHSTEEV